MIENNKEEKLHSWFYSRLIVKHSKFKMQISIGETKDFIKNANEIFLEAKKFGAIDILLSMSTELMNYHAVISPDRRKFNRYEKLSEEYRRAMTEQVRAQAVFNRFAMELNLKAKPSRIKADIDELTAIAKGNEHFKFRLYYYSAKNLYRRWKKDKIGIVDVCEEAIRFFQNCPTIMSPVVKWNFHFHLIPQLIYHGRYATAERRIKSCKKLQQIGSFNYHLTLLMQAILGITSGKLKLAASAMTEAGEEWFFTSERIVEHWLAVQNCLALAEQGGDFEELGAGLMARVYEV